MATGFAIGVYFFDDGTTMCVKVEKDRFAAADFGWTAPGAGGRIETYGGFEPRHVNGLEVSTGRRGRAIVPAVSSDIWSGAATSFVMKDDDGVAHTMVVTSRVGEQVPVTH